MTIKGAELVVVKNVVDPPPEVLPQETDVKRRHAIRLPRDRGKRVDVSHSPEPFGHVMIRAVEVTRNDGGKPRTKMSGNLRQLSVLDLPMPAA